MAGPWYKVTSIILGHIKSSRSNLILKKKKKSLSLNDLTE